MIPAEVAQAAATVLLAFIEQQSTAPANTTTVEWLSQRGSPLGSRRHIRACRELVSKGSPDARIIGRRFELTRSALERVAAELGRATPKPSANTTDELANLRRRYASLGTGS